MVKEVLNKNHVGFVVGIFFGALHAIWALAVALGFGQRFLEMVFPLHFLDNIYSVTAFSPLRALGLILMALVCGYIMGWLFTALWNGSRKWFK